MLCDSVRALFKDNPSVQEELDAIDKRFRFEASEPPHFNLYDDLTGSVAYSSKAISLFESIDFQLKNRVLVRSVRFGPSSPLGPSESSNIFNQFSDITLDKHGSPWLNQLASVHRFTGDSSKVSRDIICVSSDSFIPLYLRLSSLKENSVSSITLVESSLARLAMSFTLINLDELKDFLSSKKINFTIIYDSNTLMLQDRVLAHYSSTIPIATHGLTVLRSPRMTPAMELFSSWLSSQSGLGYRYLGTLGTSSDEFNQIVQSLWNRKKTYSVLSFSKKTFTDLPCIVVASGPSLDASIDWLSRNQDRYIIISSGSSLGALARNNIIPDISVFLERGSETYKALLELEPENAARVFSSTLGVFSESCDERAINMFSNNIRYFRPASASCHLHNVSYKNSLPFAGPESANAGLEFAACMGFQKCLLLGFDFGATDQDAPRATQALDVSPRPLDEPTRGSLGHTIYTQPSLISAADSINSLLTLFPNLMTYRVGEGYPINAVAENYSSIDCLPDFLIPKTPIDKSLLSKHILESSTLCEQFSDSDLASIINSLNKEISSLTAQFCSFLEQDDIKWSSTVLADLSRLLTANPNHNSNFALAAKVLMRQIFYYTSAIIYDAPSLSSRRERVSLSKDLFLLQQNITAVLSKLPQADMETWDPSAL